MTATSAILARYKSAFKKRYLDVMGRTLQVPCSIPADPKAALLLGLQMGRREGYGEGLVDGTQLGLDVGLETAEEALSQTVIFGMS